MLCLAKDCNQGRKRCCTEKVFEGAAGERIKFSVYILPSPACSVRLCITALNKLLNADLNLLIPLHSLVKTALKKSFSSLKHFGYLLKRCLLKSFGEQ